MKYVAPLLLLSFLLPLHAAHAEIQLVNSANVLNISNNNSGFTSSNYTPASNDNVLVVVVHGVKFGDANNMDLSEQTWGGADVTAYQALLYDEFPLPWTGIWVIPNPGTTAQQFSYTRTQTEKGSSIDIFEFSGVDTTSPVVSTTTDGGSSVTSTTLSFTTSNDGAVLVGGVGVEGIGHTPFTPASDTTEATEGETPGGTATSDIAWSSFYRIASTAGSYSIGTSWSNAIDATAAGVELRPAGDAAPAAPVQTFTNTFFKQLHTTFTGGIWTIF